MKELNLNSNRLLTVKKNNYNNNLSFLSGLAYRWVGLIEMILVSEPNSLKQIDLSDLSIMAYAEQKNNLTLLAKRLVKFAHHVRENLKVQYSQHLVNELVAETQQVCQLPFVNFNSNAVFFYPSLEVNQASFKLVSCLG